MHDGVDFFYANGFLINFYAHGLATGYKPYPLTAGYLIPDYIQYGMNTQLHPRPWPANARDVYQWWLNRSTVRVTSAYGTNGSHSVATVAITGAQDTNTAIEILAVGSGSAFVSQLLTNGVLATTNSYRTVGEVIKVQVGTAVTNVQLEYFPGPLARDDAYTTVRGQPLSVGATAGVLSNDWSGAWSGLSAIANGGPSHGTLTLNLDGSFTYTPTNGFWGTECFTYEATDGVNNFGTATVTVLVTPTANALFSDDFTRCKGTALNPWQVYSGTWSLGSGVMQGSSSLETYGYCYVTKTWAGYSVQASVQFSAGAYGGGLGGCLDPSTGAHYAAWIYPEGSVGGSSVLALIKFSDWLDWGNGVAQNNHIPMAQVSLASVGTTNHIVKLAFNTSHIDVYYDDLSNPKISTSDTNVPIYSSGGVSLEMWTDLTVYNMSVSNLIVAPYP